MGKLIDTKLKHWKAANAGRQRTKMNGAADVNHQSCLAASRFGVRHADDKCGCRVRIRPLPVLRTPVLLINVDRDMVAQLKPR